MRAAYLFKKSIISAKVFNINCTRIYLTLNLVASSRILSCLQKWSTTTLGVLWSSTQMRRKRTRPIDYWRTVPSRIVQFWRWFFLVSNPNSFSMALNLSWFSSTSNLVDVRVWNLSHPFENCSILIRWATFLAVYYLIFMVTDDFFRRNRSGLSVGGVSWR